jgi:hypothetical protein
MAHPVLAVRAITMGWAICRLYEFGFGPKLLVPLESWLFGLSSSSFVITSPWFLLMWTESLVVYAASGWTVARLNRRHRTAMVMAFATSVLLFDLRAVPWILFHGANILTNSRFLPYLLNDMANLMLRPVIILLGGLSGVLPANELEHQSNTL